MEAGLTSAEAARPAAVVATTAASGAREWLGLLATLFKLRIGLSIVLSAIGGALVAAGSWPAAGDVGLLSLAVLMAASGAAGCNHYFERDIDGLMRRTRGRPFVSGRCRATPAWPLAFAGLMAAGSGLAAWRFGWASGAYVLAGALTYALVYTLWLKRRTDWGIVIGGLAGSFAVLGGAAAYDPGVPSLAVLLLATVLFLWTPSHFWSLAIALCDDYRRAGVPMLPVTRGIGVAARWTLVNTLLLVASSIWLALVLQDGIILAGAALGGLHLLHTHWRIQRDPRPPVAMAGFRASLVQLGLFLGAMFLAYGWP